jgi:sensor histidine kinase regulating citrate/malate metabolism
VRPRLSLAGQFLVLQLAIVAAVVVVVAGVSVAQSNASFQHNEGQRLLSVAETVAATPTVQGLEVMPRKALAGVAETARGYTGQSYVLIADADGVLLTGPDVGDRIPLDDSQVLAGRSWVGTVDDGGIRSLVAHAPIYNAERGVVGLVAVGRAYPTIWEQLSAAVPNLAVYLLLGGLLGVVGSLLLARRVKRQTLGLEPNEIVGLVEHREAMLHGIREGVLGLDPAGRITLANDEGLRLLGIGSYAVGRDLDTLGLPQPLVDALLGRTDGTDQVVLAEDRILVLNRMPIEVRGRPIGAVATLRDRTELVTLQRELDTSRTATDTLRAQAHEFTNRLHTIAGLVELGEYDEVARYVHRASRAHAALTEQVTSRIADPSLAALLVAKASLATEHGVRLRLAETSALPQVDESLSADLVTVVGNLVDNALDAVGRQAAGRDGAGRDGAAREGAARDGAGRKPPPGGSGSSRPAGGEPAKPDGSAWVEVEIGMRDGDVVVVVRDSGPGVDLAEDVFRQGYSTKSVESGHLGLGLTLARVVCVRRGGEITVRNDPGAVFTVRLPALVGASS